jgi:hypothetical protein
MGFKHVLSARRLTILSLIFASVTYHGFCFADPAVEARLKNALEQVSHLRASPGSFSDRTYKIRALKAEMEPLFKALPPQIAIRYWGQLNDSLIVESAGNVHLLLLAFNIGGPLVSAVSSIDLQTAKSWLAPDSNIVKILGPGISSSGAYATIAQEIRAKVNHGELCEMALNKSNMVDAKEFGWVGAN